MYAALRNVTTRFSFTVLEPSHQVIVPMKWATARSTMSQEMVRDPRLNTSKSSSKGMEWMKATTTEWAGGYVAQKMLPRRDTQKSHLYGFMKEYTVFNP